MTVGLEHYRARFTKAKDEMFGDVEAIFHDAARVMSPAGLADYTQGSKGLCALGRGYDLVLSFLENIPAVARECGEDVIRDCVGAAMKFSSMTSGEVIALLFSSLPTAARRLGDPERLRGYLQLVHQLAAHIRYSTSAISAQQLSPVQMFFIGLVVDARVELCAAKKFPGLARLWGSLLARRYEQKPENPTVEALEAFAHLMSEPGAAAGNDHLDRLGESTGEVMHGSEKAVLELTREAATLVATAIEGIGDPFAVQGFASDGRADLLPHPRPERRQLCETDLRREQLHDRRPCRPAAGEAAGAVRNPHHVRKTWVDHTRVTKIHPHCPAAPRAPDFSRRLGDRPCRPPVSRYRRRPLSAFAGW